MSRRHSNPSSILLGGLAIVITAAFATTIVSGALLHWFFVLLFILVAFRVYGRVTSPSRRRR